MRSQADSVAAHELLLYGNNHANLYRQHEVSIQNNLMRRWKKGTYDHTKAITIWGYWTDLAAKLYTKEHGTGGGYGIFTKATRELTAKEKADEWAEEMSIQHPKTNPGARWHDSKQREADQLDRAATKKWQQDFYHGKSVAHSESALAAKSLGMNPRRPHGKFRSCVKQVRRSLRHYRRPGDPKKICGAVLNPDAVKTDEWTFKKGVVLLRIWQRSPHSFVLILTDNSKLSEANRIQFLGRYTSRAKANEAAIQFIESSLSHLKDNPIAIYGLGNPRLNGRINAKIEGVIYNRVVEVKAQKTGYQPGYYRHTFSRKNQVKIFGLDNGDLLLHSTAGVKLWNKD